VWPDASVEQVCWRGICAERHAQVGVAAHAAGKATHVWLSPQGSVEKQ
jgi:hypothetical protein